MFCNVSPELEAAVKALREAAEQRANFLTASTSSELTLGSQTRDQFYDAIATFAEEALKEIKRSKIGF
jgi:ribonuclease HI